MKIRLSITNNIFIKNNTKKEITIAVKKIPISTSKNI